MPMPSLWNVSVPDFLATPAWSNLNYAMPDFTIPSFTSPNSPGDTFISTNTSQDKDQKLENNDEIKKAKNDELSFSESKSKIAGTISMFASYLEQSLRTLSRCRKISGRDKGILDTKYLPAIAKNLTKNVFYSKKQGISLDTTVSILLDESGSMGEENKYITCRNTAIALAEVLNRLGIKFEILGHHAGWGYTHNTNGVHYHRLSRMLINEYKCFDEQYEKVKFRLGNTQHRYGNVDGEALLHTFKRCMNQRSNRHIIFVLSDGEPSGAINDTINCGHLKTAIDFCRKNGAEVYGFGIKTICPKRFYGEKYFIHLASDDDFKTSFFRKVADIISLR
jgi:cobalamin biosynthesis protein CobT